MRAPGAIAGRPSGRGQCTPAAARRTRAAHPGTRADAATSPEPAGYARLRDADAEVAGAPSGAAPRAGLARRAGRDLAGAGSATRRPAGWQPVSGDTWLVTGTLPAAKEASR
jgi:hypothetical protein